MDQIPQRREVAVFLALVAFLYCSITRDLAHWNHGNEWSRLSTMFAVVEHGTLAINPYVSNTRDWSRFEGNYYSNKAPAPAILAVPFYFVQHLIDKALGVSDDDWRARNFASYSARFFTSTLPTLFGLLLLYLVLLRRLEMTPLAALGVCAAWAVGSLSFVYSIVFFGHQTSAAFFAIGMCLSLLDDEKLFWAGLSMGVAVAADYICALPVSAWTIWLFWNTRDQRRRWQLRRAWILGGAIPALLILVYHHVCFGSIFASPYSDGIVNPEWQTLNTTTAPDLSRLADVTVRPWRGIFYCTPVWALVLVGLDPFRKLRAELRTAAVTVVVFFFYLSMLPSAFGGWCIGPRYFVCALPLAALLLTQPARELPRLFGFLLALSSALMLVGVLVDPLPAEQLKDPFHDYLVPYLEHNGATPQSNVFAYIFGLTRMQSFAAYAALCAGVALWLWRRLRPAV